MTEWQKVTPEQSRFHLFSGCALKLIGPQVAKALARITKSSKKLPNALKASFGPADMQEQITALVAKKFDRLTERSMRTTMNLLMPNLAAAVFVSADSK